MSDSVKLKVEHAVWFLIFSHIFAIATGIFLFLTITSNDLFFILICLAAILLGGCIIGAYDSLNEAIEISKKEGYNKKSNELKRKSDTEDDDEDIDIICK